MWWFTGSFVKIAKFYLVYLTYSPPRSKIYMIIKRKEKKRKNRSKNRKKVSIDWDIPKVVGMVHSKLMYLPIVLVLVQLLKRWNSL